MMTIYQPYFKWGFVVIAYLLLTSSLYIDIQTISYNKINYSQRDGIDKLVYPITGVNYLLATQTLNVAGYLIASNATGIAIREVDSHGSVLRSIEILNGFTIENQYPASWNIVRPDSIALSPNGESLAFIAKNRINETALFILNLQVIEINQYNVSINSSVIPIWSPDSTAIILYSEVTTGISAFLFETVSEELTAIIEGQVTGLQWLPDSNTFIYIGPEVCSNSTCKADTDLYIGYRSTRNTEPLTTLDVSTLNLHNAPVFDMTFGSFTWSDNSNRIYGELSELDGDLELLYSVDLTGQFNLEDTMSTYYPDSVIKPEVVRVFAKPAADEIYIILETGQFRTLAYKWSIFIHHQITGVTEVIFEKNFLNFHAEETIISYAVSPDGRYIALAGEGTSTNSLLIVDTFDQQLILDIQLQYPACVLNWLDASNLIYSQNSQTKWENCASFRNNQPFESLFTYNLDRGSTVTVAASQGGISYFLPVEAKLAQGNLIPRSNAGADRTVTPSNSLTATITLDGSASTDHDGTITTFEWTENGQTIATGATPTVNLRVGTHTITLTVTDNDGLSASDTVQITVESKRKHNRK